MTTLIGDFLLAPMFPMALAPAPDHRRRLSVPLLLFPLLLLDRLPLHAPQLSSTTSHQLPQRFLPCHARPFVI
ncbi:hypothetical protein DPMN_043358 [Dreissena polymorpha]|uniref:Uncharacterized protein n=1 Tax=Dreissena polymorpha TaxID=45954 RepID=A0A9D4D177_DREPO|nr:hypothetical protein DPMN_043358 [Dreissena polymorpha]